VVSPNIHLITRLGVKKIVTFLGFLYAKGDREQKRKEHVVHPLMVSEEN